MQIVTMAIARATQFVSVVLLTLLGVQLTAAAIGKYISATNLIFLIMMMMMMIIIIKHSSSVLRPLYVCGSCIFVRHTEHLD